MAETRKGGNWVVTLALDVSYLSCVIQPGCGLICSWLTIRPWGASSLQELLLESDTTTRNPATGDITVIAICL